MNISRLLLILFMLLLVFTKCEDQREDQPVPETDEGSWVIYSPLKWSHDGYPITGDVCKVYSDGASYSLKQQSLVFAESMFEDVLSQFSFDKNDDFRFPPENNSRINVYIDTDHGVNVAYAYYGTIFITIKTSSLDPSRYAYLFKHELTHEFEFLIEGQCELGTDVWFREAIAIYCGGGFDYINTVDDIEDWIQENDSYPGKGNPIMIHVWDDFPEGASIHWYYCKAFDITMKYLLDPLGLNKSIQDVLNVFYDVRDGSSFGDAFENNFGLSLEVFEDEYYDRIKAYLEAINS